MSNYAELLALEKEYLLLGGLFNPESMFPQDAVRDLVIDLASAIRTLEAQLRAAQQRANTLNLALNNHGKAIGELQEALSAERKVKEAAYREIDAWRNKPWAEQLRQQAMTMSQIRAQLAAETPRAYYQFGPTDTRSGLIPHVVGGSVESITALRKLVEEK